MDFLKQLNESQRAAVEYIDGASLVIAGAGSGKTRVLTYKIAYLLTQGYKPWEIMALTFTNKAAREMKDRIINLVGSEAQSLQMGTFHSVFAKILRREAKFLAGGHYDSNFTIYDEADSRSLCKSIVKQLELDDKIYKPADVHNRISWAKNKLMMPEQYAEDMNVLSSDRDSKMPEMAKIYEMYVVNCRKSNAMDFDDLLVYTFRLFYDNPEIKKQYSAKYKFLLVDEYQDTNYAQQQIVWQLASEHHHVCVVGDDAQSIYGFRGANIDNILDFQQQYEGSRLFKLEQNYRSTQRIVQAANSLIKHNGRQIEKNVFSENAEGDKLIMRQLASDREEAISVCRDIKTEVRRNDLQFKDFAILYRTNYQSRTFEEQMLKDGIPYRIYGGMSFYQRKEIKDIVAYFRLVVNHNDEEAFRRIVNYPARGIGDTTVQKLLAGANAYRASLWEVSANPAAFGVSISKGIATKLEGFRSLISSFAERLETDDAFALGADIIKKSGITEDIYSGSNPEDVSRQENLDEFLASMQDFVESSREEGLPTGLVDFLQDVSLMSDKDSGDAEDDNKVTLMTIHSAKGLEFPHVFVVGMEENIFPSPMCTDSMRKLEEERRLLYVAITRAEKRCVLTCAKSRYRFGRMEFDAPSRFLKDIDSRLVHVERNDDDYGSTGYGASRGGNGYGYGGYGSSSSYGRGNSRMQNSNPVASQFMADPKPKITSPQRQEKPVNPYGEAFERKIAASGGSLKRVHEALSQGTNRSNMLRGTNAMDASATVGDWYNGLTVGMKVEHTRFGVGMVTALEGKADSAKATVEFRNAGTKQLLLKFAKLKKL
ncbi:MAG: 3'-5' exonuclease [Prevotellaceae bacterium]|nr:3'-5' exonuclease [Prevotellaceae bacterium]